MKKQYIKPMMVGEQFIANEFISTCGMTESGKYIFICDAPEGELYYYPWGNGYGARYIGSYTPCGKTHETDGPDYYYDGFVDYNKNKREDPGESKLVWVERGILGSVRNAHASASLTRDMIETVRS